MTVLFSSTGIMPERTCALAALMLYLVQVEAQPSPAHAVVLSSQGTYFLWNASDRGDRCEDGGYETIDSADECQYAAARIRCTLTVSLASCSGAAGPPQGCSVGPVGSSSGTFVPHSGCVGSSCTAQCSASTRCICRSSDGAYSLLSSGTCDSAGLALVDGLQGATTPQRSSKKEWPHVPGRHSAHTQLLGLHSRPEVQHMDISRPEYLAISWLAPF